MRFASASFALVLKSLTIASTSISSNGDANGHTLRPFSFTTLAFARSVDPEGTVMYPSLSSFTTVSWNGAAGCGSGPGSLAEILKYMERLSSFSSDLRKTE